MRSVGDDSPEMQEAALGSGVHSVDPTFSPDVGGRVQCGIPLPLSIFLAILLGESRNMASQAKPEKCCVKSDVHLGLRTVANGKPFPRKYVQPLVAPCSEPQPVCPTAGWRGTSGGCLPDFPGATQITCTELRSGLLQ